MDQIKKKWTVVVTEDKLQKTNKTKANKHINEIITTLLPIINT